MGAAPRRAPRGMRASVVCVWLAAWTSSLGVAGETTAPAAAGSTSAPPPPPPPPPPSDAPVPGASASQPHTPGLVVHPTVVVAEPWSFQTTRCLSGAASIVFALGQHTPAALTAAQVAAVSKSCSPDPSEMLSSPVFAFPFVYASPLGPAHNNALALLATSGLLLVVVFALSAEVDACLARRREDAVAAACSGSDPVSPALFSTPSPWSRVAHRLTHPTIPLCVFFLLYQGIAFACAALFFAEGAGWRVLGGVAAAGATVGLPMWCAHAVRKGVHDGVVRFEFIERSQGVPNSRRARREAFFLGAGEWVAVLGGTTWLGRYGSLLRSLRSGWEAWLAVECAACLCIAVTETLPVHDASACAMRKYFTATVLAVLLTVRLWVRPAHRAFDHLCDVCVGVLLTAASLTLGIGASLAEKTPSITPIVHTHRPSFAYTFTPHYEDGAAETAAAVMLVAAAIIAILYAVCFVACEIISSHRRSALRTDVLLQGAARRFVEKRDAEASEIHALSDRSGGGVAAAVGSALATADNTQTHTVSPEAAALLHTRLVSSVGDTTMEDPLLGLSGEPSVRLPAAVAAGDANASAPKAETSPGSARRGVALRPLSLVDDATAPFDPLLFVRGDDPSEGRDENAGSVRSPLRPDEGGFGGSATLRRPLGDVRGTASNASGRRLLRSPRAGDASVAIASPRTRPLQSLSSPRSHQLRGGSLQHLKRQSNGTNGGADVSVLRVGGSMSLNGPATTTMSPKKSFAGGGNRALPLLRRSPDELFDSPARSIVGLKPAGGAGGFPRRSAAGSLLASPAASVHGSFTVLAPPGIPSPTASCAGTHPLLRVAERCGTDDAVVTPTTQRSATRRRQMGALLLQQAQLNEDSGDPPPAAALLNAVGAAPPSPRAPVGVDDSLAPLPSPKVRTGGGSGVSL